MPKQFSVRLNQSQFDRRVLIYNGKRTTANKLYEQILQDYHKHFKGIYDPDQRKAHLKDIMSHLYLFHYVDMEFSTPISKFNFRVRIQEPK